MLQLKREINQFKILIDKEQVRMNFNPFQGDSPDMILKYGWMVIIELAVVWSITYWIIDLLLPEWLSFFLATWLTLIHIGRQMDSPLSNPANNDKSWEDE